MRSSIATPKPVHVYSLQMKESKRGALRDLASLGVLDHKMPPLPQSCWLWHLAIPKLSVQ